jgi:hypothetical protein
MAGTDHVGLGAAVIDGELAEDFSDFRGLCSTNSDTPTMDTRVKGLGFTMRGCG